MTQDEIIEMLRASCDKDRVDPEQNGFWVIVTDELVAFANLVAQHERSWEKFCDSHCVWTDHHPDCKLAKDEPVAWAMLHDNGHFIDAIHPNEHARVEGEYITPLYTTPPQRKPLTDETRNWIVATCPTPRHIIDAVERMHGIKGEA
jgi:hypothetical protein